MSFLVRLARFGVPLVAAAAMWLLLPASLGGGTTFLTTSGVSMEPLLSGGDLAVLRTGDHYAVGDVIAYRSDALGTTVLHRIIAADGARFTTQGDNNSWTDPDHPVAEQVLGRYWLAIPRGGQVLSAFRSPLVLAASGLAVTLVSVLLGSRRRRAQRGHPGAMLPAGTRASRSLPAGVRSGARRLAPAAAATAGVALVGGAVAFLLPTTETVSSPSTVEVRDTWSYTGSARAGVTYPDGTVETGDPVWRSLASALTIGLARSVDAPDVPGLSGPLTLDLSVSTPDGWSAPLPGSGTTGAADHGVAASVALDLDTAAELAAAHFAEIGVSAGAATVTVTPVGELTGSLEGIPFTAVAAAPLSFNLDDAALTPAAGGDAAFAATTSVELPSSAVTPRTVPLLGFTAPVTVLRGLACLVLAGALVVLAAAGRLGPDRDAAADLCSGARTVRIEALPATGTCVDVPDALSLRRIADARDALVLHLEEPDGAAFLVQDGAVTYRFRPVAAGRGPVVTRTYPAVSPRKAPTLTGLFARLARI